MVPLFKVYAHRWRIHQILLGSETFCKVNNKISSEIYVSNLNALFRRQKLNKIFFLSRLHRQVFEKDIILPHEGNVNVMCKIENMYNGMYFFSHSSILIIALLWMTDGIWYDCRTLPGTGARSPVLWGECLHFLRGRGGFWERCPSCSLLKVMRIKDGGDKA